MLAWSLTALAVCQTGLVDTTHFRVGFTLNDVTAPAAEFGRLSGLALDTAGTLYVSDLSQHHILAFDRNGKFRGTIGREGQGPGEFDAPAGLVFDAQGRLFVRDLLHVSRFIWDPRTRLVSRYDSAFAGPLYPNWTSGRASRIDAAGRYYYPQTTTPHDGTSWHQFYRYSTDDLLLDSLRVPSMSTEPPGAVYIQTPPPCCRIIPGLTHVPFAPLPVWDVLPDGRVVWGDGTRYRLQISALDGKPPTVITGGVQIDPIPSAERAESVAALRRRLDSLPIPAGRIPRLPRPVASMEVPRTFPPYNAVYASQDGTIWVRRWKAGEARPSTVFDVYASSGQPITTVELPIRALPEPTPILSLRRVVVAVEDPETGALSVSSLVPR